MHRHQLRPVGKRRLDLDVVDHFGDAIHALLARDDLRAGLHQVGHGAAVPRALNNKVGDNSNRLRVIELDAALEAAPGDHRGHGNEKLVLFTGRQIHARKTRFKTLS